MKSDARTRFVKDVQTGKTEFRAKKPFTVERDNKRRFVRLEISAPMSLKTIKDLGGNFWPEGDWHIINGVILNISGGGVLVELDQAVNESDIVSMHFTLEDVEGLNNVLGVIKRVDAESDCYLAGIEFVSRKALVDHLSKGEVEMLSEDHKDFDESVRDVLSRYVYREAVASEAG